MAYLNKVFLMGNLTRDPELKFTPQGKAVCGFHLATNRNFKGQDGEMKKQTDFFPVVSWGTLAENINKFLKKGSPVHVEGRMQNRTYETKEGQKRTVTEIVADSVLFLNSGHRDSERSPAQEPENEPGDFQNPDEVPF